MECQFALVLAQQHRVEDALLHYHEAVRLYHEQLRQQPDSPDILNTLACLLATNPNAEIRDGKEAVALALHARDLTSRKRPGMLNTLAAAYAETGQFDEAVKTAQAAHGLALDLADKETAAQATRLLKLFQAHQRYREPF